MLRPFNGEWTHSPYPDCPGIPKARDAYSGDRNKNPVLEYIMENLDAFIFGDCQGELGYYVCECGVGRGIHFVCQNGKGASGLMLGYANEASAIAAQFDGLSPAGMDFINSELTAYYGANGGFVLCGKEFNSEARFFNTRIWGVPQFSADVQGGSLVFDTASFRNYAPFLVDGARLTLINNFFDINSKAAAGKELEIKNGGQVTLVGNMSAHGMRCNADAPPSAMTAQFQNQRNSPLPPGAKEISVTLGKTQKRLGLSLREHSVESENVPVTRGGRAAWASARHPPQAPDSYMMYWLVKFPEFRNGGAPKVTISVEYFDEGTGDFRICYDSSDRSVKALPHAPGAWKTAAVFKLTDTKTWKTIECTVPDALFEGRCNGADLRFDIHSGDARPAIASVKITRAE